jgi:SNF2 family DNA or RNA helicase
VSFVLYDHQKEMLRLLTENDRFMLLAEVGTGKSLPMLIHLSNLLLGGEISNVLLVAPLSGLGAWTRDTEKLSADRQRVLKKAITYINYDKISRASGRYQKDCWKAWDCIVLDESHAIAKPTSNRTQYFVGKGKNLGLASKCKYRYLITGTLINNSRLEDAWSPLRFILDDDWMTWVDFKRHYLVTKQLPGSYVELVIGYRHREELLATIARYSYRVLKKDCLDLPEELPDEVITVPFAPGKNTDPFVKTTSELYDDALESYVEALDKVMDNPLSRLMVMRQIATGHVKESDTRDERGRVQKGTTHPLNSLKTRYAMELIENNRPRKTVVGYHFRASCAILEAALKAKHIKYVVLNGDQPDKNIWRKFQADPSTTVILVQYQAGSQAIDLFASSYTIFFEPMDSSMLCTQFRARTHRNGQTQTCGYVFLLTEGSVEMDMYAKLNSHQDFSERLYRDVAIAKLRGEGR